MPYNNPIDKIINPITIIAVKEYIWPIQYIIIPTKIKSDETILKNKVNPIKIKGRPINKVKYPPPNGSPPKKEYTGVKTIINPINRIILEIIFMPYTIPH